MQDTAGARSIEVVMRSVSSRLSLSLAMCLCALGCGGDDSGPLDDPNTFAGKYAEAIRKNCSMLSQCHEITGMPDSEDFADQCAQDSADALNDNPANQLQFVAKYTFCGAQTDICSYVKCLSLPTGYGMTQLAKVTQSCEADAACKSAQGMTSDDPEQDLVVCQGHRIGELDGYSPDQRKAYENAFTPCAALTGCDFIACFPF
jgi:hypothetical protein